MWFSLFHTLSSDVSSPGRACRFRFVGVAAFSSPCNRRSVHPRLLSSLSHTTPLRCPAFSSSPPLCWHVSESTEGPNTQTRQGLTSTFTARLQMEMEDRRAGHRGGWGGGPRRRQSSYLLEAKRKCRQRARSLRTSIRNIRNCRLPWLLGKVFWLRDDSQVYTSLRLQYGPAGCGVLPVPARVQRKLYVHLCTCEMTEACPV